MIGLALAGLDDGVTTLTYRSIGLTHTLALDLFCHTKSLAHEQDRKEVHTSCDKTEKRECNFQRLCGVESLATAIGENQFYDKAARKLPQIGDNMNFICRVQPTACESRRADESPTNICDRKKDIGLLCVTPPSLSRTCRIVTFAFFSGSSIDYDNWYPRATTDVHAHLCPEPSLQSET